MERTSRVKAATWNIGGGILGESHQRNGRPSLDYYASVLAKYSPDVVCLQEAHDYAGSQQGQSENLASQCGYPYVISAPVSRSHLVADAHMALGILSRFPLKQPQYRQFPNPGLSATGPRGDSWKMLDKGYVRTAIELGGRELGLINAHCFPFHYFGASPAEPRFANIWTMLMRDMNSLCQEAAALVAVDLNYQPVQDLLSDALGPGKYANAFENTPTTPRGGQQDYILYSDGVSLLATSVTPTESDHSYCQVSIAL